MRRSDKTCRPPLQRTPILILSDGLVLLCALCGVVFSFVSTFDFHVPALPLLGTCLLAGLFFLAVFSLPRGRHCLIALAVLIPLCAAAVWRFQRLFSLGEVSIRCTLVNRFAEEFSFLHPIYPVDSLPSNSWTYVTTLFLCALAALAALLLGWAVCRVRSFWLTFWLTFPVLLPGLCIAQIPAWPPLMVLFAAWCAMLLSSLPARQDPRGGAKLTLIALPASGTLLLLLTLAFPQADYHPPAWAASAQAQLVTWAGGASRQLSLPGGLLPGPFSGFTAAGGSESVDLQLAGPLHYTGQTMLRVQTEVRGKLYLRGYSAGVYTGSGWEPLEDSAYEELFPSSGTSPLLDFQPLNFPALCAPGTAYHPITIEVVGAPGSCVYTPYQIFTTPDEVRGAQFQNDSYLARDRNVRRHTLYFKPLDLAEWDYTPPEGELAQAQEYYNAFVHRAYLSVSDEDQEILFQWIGQVYRDHPEINYFSLDLDGIPDFLREVEFSRQQLQMLLELSTRYDPETPVIPAGSNFLDVFLNQNRRGYCMHYATASTLIFRLLGYPARYVSGYVANVPASGHVNVPDSAAHAWTEIYLEGYGWYPIDLTPGYEEDLPWAEESETPAPSPTAAVAAPLASSQPSAPPTASPTPAAAEVPSSSAGRLFLLPALLAAALPIRRIVLRRRRERCFGAKDTNQAAIAAYVYLQRLLPWGAECPSEVQALAQKAKFSPHTLTEDEREAVVSQVQREAAKTDSSLPLCRRWIFRYFYGLD